LRVCCVFLLDLKTAVIQVLHQKTALVTNNKNLLVTSLEPTPKTLSDLQKIVDVWINQFEEGYWPPLSMFAALAEEVGELAREINDREGHKKKHTPNQDDLTLELGDTLFSLICIANHYHIDLSKAVETVMEKYTQRDMHRWTPKTTK
jgi:NTP pyrophosphatase (non-canonical NTP hydrolase)